jgi:hypothetical protein
VGFFFLLEKKHKIEKNETEELIQVMIHTYREMQLGNSLLFLLVLKEKDTVFQKMKKRR